jgi:FixJ family two-component response regulator
LRGMDGLELLKHFSTVGDSVLATVIMGLDDVATIERARQSRVTFTPKPFESAAILAAIGELIGRDLDSDSDVRRPAIRSRDALEAKENLRPRRVKAETVR